MHNHTLIYRSARLAGHAKGIIAYLGVPILEPYFDGGDTPHTLHFQTAEEISAPMQAEIVEKTRPVKPIFNEGPITAAEIEFYNNYTALIGSGAATESEERYVLALDHKAAEIGMKFVVEQSSLKWVLVTMSTSEKAKFAEASEQEEEARQAEHELRQSQITASQFSSYEAYKDWEEHNR